MAIATAATRNAKLAAWVDEMTKMLRPDSVRWCDGSRDEYQEMLHLMVQSGTASWLNPKKRP